MKELQHLQYPIGKFEFNSDLTRAEIDTRIATISAFPSKLEELIIHMTPDQLEMSYRPGGWTIQQVIHHCADSHINAYVRLKLTLTEHNPVIKPYDENLWAALPDSTWLEPQVSVQLLHGLHARWTSILQSLDDSEFEKTYYHPEKQEQQSIKWQTAMYAWHCKHHLAHVGLVANATT